MIRPPDPPERRAEFVGAGLVEDYVAIARRRGPKTLEATALRTRSVGARDLLAFAATPDRLTAEELLARVRVTRGGVDVPPLDPEWTVHLARVVGFQNLHTYDRAAATALFEALRRQHGPTALSGAAQKTYAELLWDTRQYDVLRSRLPKLDKIPPDAARYILADLANPFVPEPGDARSLEEWHHHVGEIFTEHGLEPVTVSAGESAAFDGLTCRVDERITDGPRVSVIVTAYRSGPELLSSVRSICNQTWQNLEIIIIDDASPDEHLDVLDACARLDPRVQVHRHERNGGTYLARNTALDLTTGDYVTCQDSDDWSHPRRIELQVRALMADPKVPATRSHSIRVTPEIVFQRLGYEPARTNASSLMFRRAEALGAIGYFDSARKGADTEYLKRLEIALGARTEDLRAPLAMIRMAEGSLSRADFTTGWHHASRFVYQGAYARWHATLAAGGDPYLPRLQERRRFAIPQRFAIDQAAAASAPPAYDVVFLSEWRRYGGPQRSMIEEITALVRAGYRVGMAHREAFRFMGTGRPPLCPQVLDLINDGTVDFVALDQVATISLLVIRYPPILQFTPPEPSTLDVRNVVILANQAPQEIDGSDRRYTVAACDATARFMFGRDATWIAQGPSILEILAGSEVADRLRTKVMPGIIDLEEWFVPRHRFRADRPVIGRHSRNELMKWPESRDDVLEVYPDDGSVDVRIMGGDGVVRQILNAPSLPTTWVSYDYDEISVRQFLSQLDFFVYYHHPVAIEAFGRAVLEAIAAGCVAILPKHFAATFGDAAIYADPAAVRHIVADLYRDWKTYRAQVDRGLEVVREVFSHEAYIADIAGLVGEPAARDRRAVGGPGHDGAEERS